MKLYPNPASSTCFITCPDHIGHWALLSADGKQVLGGYQEDSQLSVPIADLPSGFYMMRRQSTDGKQESTILIVD